MTSIKTFAALAAGTVALSVSMPALAQTTNTQQDRTTAILGALFGNQLGGATTIDAQWAVGRTPLNTQRTQFETQVDSSVRAGSLSSTSAARLKADYGDLVQMETRYGADGRFTTAERTELSDRYGTLTQVMSDGGYVGGSTAASTSLSVSTGQADFENRTAAALASRRITRTQATGLRTEYQTLIQTEATYARNGIDAREQADLDARLDALDARLGDAPTTNGGYQTVLDNRTRLSNIDSALSTGERSGQIARSEAADIRVELGDLTRLEAAYARVTASRDDTDYLSRRLGELEVRARVNIRR